MGTLSFKIKKVLLTCLITAMAGVIISGTVYYKNSKEAINHLASDAKNTAEVWSAKITKKDVKELMQTKNRNSEAGRKLGAHFNHLSQQVPYVAQGYVFGAELKNGTDTRLVVAPTALMDALEKDGVKIGDFYTQPANIVNVIEKMKQTKKTVVSEPYKDDLGVWVTVVKPYVDQNGEVFAYYGIDYEAQSYMDHQRKVLLIVGGIFLFLLLAIIFLFIK